MSEQQYLNLCNLILSESSRSTRNGNVKSIFGHTLHFDLRDGFPLLTTKKMFLRGVIEELIWFLHGNTDVRVLQKKKVHIWDGNTEGKEGDAGPIYGFQWRHFGAKYVDCETDYTGQGVDQIAKIIDLIKTNPHSRRILLSAWNPADQDRMALPPCHVSYQFYVQDGTLSCIMYQRSSDVFLGLPFNIASTALLLTFLAHETGLKPAKMNICIGDAHIYESHIPVVKEQLARTPHGPPSLSVDFEPGHNLLNITKENVKVTGYTCHGSLKAKMVV